MDRVQNTKSQSLENHFPGCLDRMVNLFDLANGSSMARSQSDLVRMMGAHQIEDNMIVSAFQRSSSNKNATSRTPMKTLIAQELSREVDSKQKPPNLVAKLMGLDPLPHLQPYSGAQRGHTKGYSRRSLSHSGILLECWESDQNLLDKEIQCAVHHCPEQNECKDATYEVCQPSLSKKLRGGSTQKRMPDGNMNDKKMALIRQKFIELKRLATNDKGRRSNEFQEALDILSSNRDLLLKFFQEPNSVFSQHLYDMLSVPPPTETKRITVLRPSSKVADGDNMAGFKKGDTDTEPAQMNQATAAWDSNNFGFSPTFPNDEYSSAQPTRIVVLKPSPARNYDIKAVISLPSPTPRREELNGEAENQEAQESRDVANEITRQMCKNLVGHRRDEALLSADVFSNGYIGDDSSFNKSEIEYPTGDHSDSETVSPTSRHSWDYINRIGSPYSLSSCSRPSCFIESSVCREAKKRLSERWAMMTSNMSYQQQNDIQQRSSSTLGEMLALSDTKKPVAPKEEPENNEQELEASTSYLACNQNREEGVEESPRSLLRSKSLPVSSSIYGVPVNVEISDSEAIKAEVPKQLTKTKSMKSSLRGKVSSLFFSKNKKPKDKSASQSDTAEVLMPHPGRIGSDGSSCIGKNDMKECCSPSLGGSHGNLKQGSASHEGVLIVAKPEIAGSTIENQDHPSPISVLEAPFEEDDLNITELCANIKLDRRGPELLSKSNLIDKAPPIESNGPRLSWEHSSCTETTASSSSSSSSSSYSLKPSSAEEERDLLSFMDTLLLAAGLDEQSQMDIEDSNFPRWHSPESPLDPSLRDKLASETDKEVAVVHEAKRRQIRSSRKLVFDCLNLAFSDIIIATRDGPENSSKLAWGGCCGGPTTAPPAMEAVEHVLRRLRVWVGRRDEEGDGGSSVVRKEVAGKGWMYEVATEVENVGKEIEGNLLEELVEEALVDLTCR